VRAVSSVAALAALHGIGAGVAGAQTVVATNAPPGATVELVLNATPAGRATADARGQARFALELPTRVGKPEIDARIYVDVCPEARRIVLAEPAVPEAPATPGCHRREMIGVYVVRRVTTLVVDLTEASPAVRIRQGPPPREWLQTALELEGPPRPPVFAPRGLVLFGGSDVTVWRNVGSVYCGNVTSCTPNATRPAYTAGLAYWLLPGLAAEAAYVRLTRATVTGSEANYRFDTRLDAELVTVAAKVGGRIGRVRLFGSAGTNYHRATITTTETIDPYTLTLDDGQTTVTVEGGTQIFQARTTGWGWLVGGGVDVWLTRQVGVYAEGGRITVKGSGAGAARTDDWLMFLAAGLRVYPGR
jgi:hypothetical protein